MKKILNTVKYILFLGIGIFLFSLIYNEYNLSEFLLSLKDLKWGWIIVSLIFGFLSHLSRAIRWKMLISPLGYKPRTINTLLSVLIMYATNLIIPRGGEIARCTILSRNAKIPFGKLVGTVVTERATDALFLLILVFITIFSQIGIFKQFLNNNPEFGQNFGFLFTIWFWLCAFTATVIALLLIWKLRNRLKKIKIIEKIFGLLFNFFQGIKSIRKLKNPGQYIFHTLFIYIMYFLMMYVVLFSYSPTANTTFTAALTAFVMSGLAMLAPVQGGIGAWHFMVIETLSIYGLDKAFGKDFALISHTSMNLFLLIAGGVSLILLPFFSKKNNLVSKNIIQE